MGRLHLLDAGEGSLVHWSWNGSGWQSETPLSLPLSSQRERPMQLLAASVNQQGNMMVLLAKPMGQGDASPISLFFSTRTLELLPQQTSTEVALTPTLPAATSTPKPLSTPTTTPGNPSATPGQAARVETDGSVSPIMMALLPVALLLLVVLGVVFRRVNQTKDR